MRGFKYMMLDGQFLVDMCKEGEQHFKVTKNALPSDALFQHAGHDSFGRLYLVISSNSFPLINPYDQINSIEPLFDKIIT